MSHTRKMTKREKGDQLADRLARFSGTVLKIVGELPNSKEGRHVRDQLVKSGTAPGAHYAEARGAQSAEDFIYKISVALKEQRESLHWVHSAHYAGWFASDVHELIREGGELVAILTASKQTAQRNLDKQ